MSTPKRKKQNSRWSPGNERYTDAQRTELEKYKEPTGWRNGARVRRK
jgi:hypothetical protein